MRRRGGGQVLAVLAALLTVCAPLPLWSSPSALTASPRPAPRPALPLAAAVDAGADAAGEVNADAAALAAQPPTASPALRPLARPADLARHMPVGQGAGGTVLVQSPLQPLPEQLQRVAALPGKRQAVPGQLSGKAGALCGIPGLSGRPIAPIVSRVQGCGLQDGVEVTAVSGIPLSVPAQIDCRTAAALKHWVDRGIVPVVGNQGGGIARLEIAGSYSCRPRNNQKGAKVSEHGRGRAVDLTGIRLRSGEVVSVEQHWRSGKGKLLQQIHAAACGPFGTVLGPKSDRFHHDHIHVDTAARRAGGSYCR